MSPVLRPLARARGGPLRVGLLLLPAFAAACSPCATRQQVWRFRLDEHGHQASREEWTRTWTCDDERQVETMTEYVGGSTDAEERTTFTYDEAGRVVMREEWGYPDAKDTRHDLWILTYDDAGRLVEEAMVSGPNRVMVYERITSTWDDSGCLAGRTRTLDDGDVDWVETNTCDAAGRVVVTETEGLRSVVRQEFTYDDEDRVIRRWLDTGLDVFETVEYGWDRKDRLLTESWLITEGDTDRVEEYAWDYANYRL